MALTAQLAYYYDWKYSYYFMMLLILLAIVCILIFFKYAPRQFSIPLKDMHLRSMLIVSVAMLMLIYVISYGKVLDWFPSNKIVLYVCLAPCLLCLFFWHQKNLDKPYINLVPLRSKKRILGYLYMMLAMFFSSSSTLVTSYLTSVIRVDSVHANTVCLWLLPGFMVGAFICFWWFRLQRWRFRFIVCGGLFCFVIYFEVLYFGVSSSSTYEMLYLPTFFRGMGMMILIIPFSLYVVEKLEPKYLLSNAFFLISFRSVLSPVIGLSFFLTYFIYSNRRIYMCYLKL